MRTEHLDPGFPQARSMIQATLLAALCCCVHVEAHILPDGMLGSWHSKVPVTSIQGPFFNIKFWAARDAGASRFALQIPLGNQLEESQVFFAKGFLMQYCFAVIKDAQHSIKATAPFQLHAATSTSVEFCWRGPRLPNHAANCTGCSCAKLMMNLAAEGNLHITFLESPPAVHFQTELSRIGAAPGPQHFFNLLGGINCDFENRTGFLAPEPQSVSKSRGHLCPVSGGQAHAKVLKGMQVQQRSDDTLKSIGPVQVQHCINLNGGVNKTLWTADLRLQYSVPQIPCMPCNVSFSFSAVVAPDQYIAIGFKERFEFYTDDIPDQPNYFGMSSSDFTPVMAETTEQFPLRGRIMAGYASSSDSCAREMREDAYVGPPVDTAGSFSAKSAKRSGNRTVLRFTAQLSLPWQSGAELSPTAKGKMGAERVMWAIGNAESGDCSANLSYHGSLRGLSSLIWFNNPVCAFDAGELGENSFEDTVLLP